MRYGKILRRLNSRASGWLSPIYTYRQVVLSVHQIHKQEKNIHGITQHAAWPAVLGFLPSRDPHAPWVPGLLSTARYTRLCPFTGVPKLTVAWPWPGPWLKT
ncbi:hypothetical protein BHM03_00007553 [Ensete ventricosum]|nr:hypothetical protein BHM03_00007553 [Ensete ventricosum]